MNHRNRLRTQGQTVAVAVLPVALFWLLDAAVGYFAFPATAPAGDASTAALITRLVASLLFLGSGTAVALAMTRRRLAEDALQQSRRDYDALAETSGDIVSVHDRAGRYVYANRACAGLIGKDPNGIIGRTPQELFPTEAAREMQCSIQRVFVTRERVEIENSPSLQAAGREFSAALSPVFDAAGEVVAAVGMSRDITERRRLDDQLRQSQLLASLGQMTAGIAHEVNNPLGSILLYSEMLLQGSLSSQAKQDLKVIHDEARRAAAVMADLLTYARSFKPALRLIDLRGVLRKVVEMRRYQQSVNNIDLALNLPAEPLYVKGSAQHLRQVFVNLLLNAESALQASDGGNIIVDAGEAEKWVRVSIADDGPGIPDDKLTEVFYPFFTTKETGEGSGLGLTASYGIVAGHHGLIHAENNSQGGATLVVELPAADVPTTRQPRTAAGSGSAATPGQTTPA
ncbi:MAG: PAS domain-containing protein [Dehalococcoidales bacterium]